MDYSDILQEFEEEEIIYEKPTNFAECFNFPIVYTKRLDDMKILRDLNLDALSIKDITTRIVEESKPTLVHFPKRPSRKYKNKISKSVKWTELEPYTLYELSSDAEDIPLAEIRNKSKHFQNQCKKLEVNVENNFNNVQLSSPDEDSVDQSHIRTIFLNGNDDTTDFMLDEVVIEVPHTQTPKALFFSQIQPISHSANTNSTVYKISNSYLILTYMYADYKDIYYIDDHDVITEHYRVKDTVTNDYFIDASKYTCTIEISNCCWYKREEKIRQLFTIAKNKSMSKFMSEKHPCIPKECVCCCKVKTECNKSHVLEASSLLRMHNKTDTRIGNLASSGGLDIRKWFYLKNSTRRRRCIIKTAILYEPKLPKRSIYIKVKKNYRQFTTIHTLRKYTGNVEYYYLNESGEIQTYISVCNGSISDVYLPIESRMLEKSLYRCKTTACCWYKYKQCLLQLASSVLPSVINFLKKRHSCDLMCTCCCKSIFNVRAKKGKCAPTLNYYFNIKHTNGNTVKIIQSVKSQHNNTIHQEAQSTFKKAETNSNYIDLTEPNIERSSNQYTDIYETFKNLQLYVQQGDVTAITNTPPDELSTRNLKILAMIIRNAQKQVKQLGFTGGTAAVNNIFHKNSITITHDNKILNNKISSIANNTYSRSTTFFHKNKDRLPVRSNSIKNQYRYYTAIMGHKSEQYQNSFMALKMKCNNSLLQSIFQKFTPTANNSTPYTKTVEEVETDLGTRATGIKRKSQQDISDN
ncbi:uncharacterized protein LOC131849616 [Achroia grisella]|uniref:uncharacterized protein LOC131849616 n=1 Tax=Achroia grisella TaxID=688607 RepID=UPI0027D228BE|nr:uncharacterized protein LOC131849616 [Achroia grisella]